MDRLLLTRLIVVAGFAWGLWCARKAWNPGRLCPRTPLWAGLNPPGSEPWLFKLLFVLLAAIAVQPLPALALFLPLVAMQCACDWTRFRPWVYQHSILLLALCFPAESLNVGRLVTISIYFWSGLLKFNRMFVELVFPWIMQPVLKRLPAQARLLGYAVPFVETGLAVGLLFPQTRKAALVAVLAMHGLILACFSRWGHRTHKTIWPWNVSMALTAIVFFWNTATVVPADILLGGPFHTAVLLLFGVMPVLGLFNRLDPVFSHGHMAGRHILGHIGLSRRLFKKLPNEIRSQCVQSGYIYILDVPNWYMHDVWIPPPQNEGLLRAIARDFERYGAREGDLTLTVFRMVGVTSKGHPHKVYAWNELV